MAERDMRLQWVVTVLLNEVVNGYMQCADDIKKQSAIGVFPQGTGNDFRQNNRHEGGCAAACSAHRAGKESTPVDVCMARSETSTIRQSRGITSTLPTSALAATCRSASTAAAKSSAQSSANESHHPHLSRL